jgi:hypothetical protein
MVTLFFVWNHLFLASILLLFFRSDAKELLLELYQMLTYRDLIGLFLSIFLIYMMFPFTIIHSLINIWRRF